MHTPQQDPSHESSIPDPERQEQAKEYARIRRRLTFLDLGLGAALLLSWLLSGWSVLLRDWVWGLTTSPWLAVLAFGAIFGGAFTLLDLPLSFYTGYILPHRFKQGTLGPRRRAVYLVGKNNICKNRTFDKSEMS